MLSIKYIIRSLRLPFISISALAFLLGSFMGVGEFRVVAFMLGLACVIFTHIGANLINDYADARSGADSWDTKFYGFFGGSKLIQDGLLSEDFYLAASVLFFALAFISAISLTVILSNILTLCYYFIVLILGIAYSFKPFQFSYHRLGEFVIFVLFGPVPVMGGYFIQTQIFPDLKSFLMSAPLGFLAAAILFANEVPDYEGDIRSKKYNLVNLTGQARAYVLYLGLIIISVIFICLNVFLGYINKFSLLGCLLILPALKAALILRRSYGDKPRLIQSSKITVAIYTAAAIILILGVIL